MRDFKGMKRQRGRNRGGGGGKPQQNANRAFESNGPDGVKVRGNAQHVFEKYQQLARDAASAGDRVLAENYLQHAEHYFRLVRAIQPQRPAAEILGRDSFASGYDIDFEDENGVQISEGEAEAYSEEGEGEGRRDDRGDRPDRGDRQRDDRPRGEGREDRQRDDRQRDDRQREDRQRDDRSRDDRPRGEGRRDRWRDRDDRRDRQDRGERQDRGDRPEREPRDPMAVIEPQAAPLVAEDRDAGRPSPMLRDADGGESHAPAFLQAPRAAPAAAAEGDGEEQAARRPRRRRAPRSFEGGAPSTGETEDA